MTEYTDREMLQEKAILKLLQKEHDVHAFDDMPSGIYVISLILWATLVTLFWLFFTGDTQSRFALTVVAAFVAFFYSIPIVMTRQAKPKLPRQSSNVEICTGTVSWTEAAVQVALIPGALVLAIASMALIKTIVFSG